jgi:hypothetical protein
VNIEMIQAAESGAGAGRLREIDGEAETRGSVVGG